MPLSAHSLAGLLSLSDDLLLQILLKAGAPAVARCASLCARLRALQRALAALPAFACGASFGISGPLALRLEDHVARAVAHALQGMPAAVDFALLFVRRAPRAG